MKFKVGDRVRIRQWDDMLKEYELNYNGSIQLHNDTFPVDMRELCGKTATIKKIDCAGGVELSEWENSANIHKWAYYIEMLEPAHSTPEINMPAGWKFRRTERRNKNGDIVEIEVHAWKDIDDQAQIEEYKRLGMLV